MKWVFTNQGKQQQTLNNTLLHNHVCPQSKDDRCSPRRDDRGRGGGYQPTYLLGGYQPSSAALVKQFSAMLAKHQGTITEANAEIDRLKSENALLRKPNNDPLSVDEARVLDDFLGQTALNHAMADYKRLAPLRAVFERRQRDFDSGRPKKVKKDGDDLIDSIAVKAQVKAEVIDDSDSDSDSDVIEVNCVVYNGITYHREVNSNVLYHPKKHEVVGMWNDGRGRVDVLPINPHED